MKHISEILLQITQQQFVFQSRIDAQDAIIESLTESSSLNVLASLPQLEANSRVLSSLNARINQRISELPEEAVIVCFSKKSGRRSCGVFPISRAAIGIISNGIMSFSLFSQYQTFCCLRLSARAAADWFPL